MPMPTDFLFTHEVFLSALSEFYILSGDKNFPHVLLCTPEPFLQRRWLSISDREALKRKSADVSLI